MHVYSGDWFHGTQDKENTKKVIVNKDQVKEC